MNKHLHIVCLDVPWPADYGGAIDMMNRIIAFHKMGIKIHLHYFNYNNRGTPTELNQYCETVTAYERKVGHKGFSFTMPYIVSSRINEKLVANLNKHHYPILLEGLHCTGILSMVNTTNRKVVVRMHNEESTYYHELARSATSFLKKMYFKIESWLIKKYTSQLPKQFTYACVSITDVELFKHQYHLPNAIFVPIFPSWHAVKGEEEIGNFCLYHGNLSVSENEEAATWLLKNVFAKIKKPLVIAGKNPSAALLKLAHAQPHTCLVANPSAAEMNDLVKKAHIHLLPIFNQKITGIRLKLLHTLFEGRHCVTTAAMVKGTGLADACHIGTTADSFASIIMQLSNHPFTIDEINLRKKLLGNTYDNDVNAHTLIQYLW
ncbi:MAG: hypothetical protein RL115_1405 [Bacteroidota bacterium]|jgi:hypothetical protein